jgi:hypothetical protein
MLKLSVSGMGKPPSRHLLWLQTPEGTDTENEVSEGTQNYNRKGVLFKLNTPSVSLRRRSEARERGTAVA